MIGIYIINCKANNKVYIGQSIDIKNRLRGHKYALRKGIHQNAHLQNAFNQYGESEFLFEVLCEMPKEEYTKERLNVLEILYISFYQSNDREKGFNIESGGNGNGRASEETRKKLRIAHTGKRFSEETKKLFSMQRKGKPSHLKGKQQTQEHIQKRICGQVGKVWVSKGTDSKFVTKEEAETLLPQGYNYGRPFQKRIKGKKYEYNGGSYTIPQIASICKIDKAVINSRLRKGWTLEKATSVPITSPQTNSGKYLYKGEYLKLTYISQLVNIDYEKLRGRLRKGMTLEEAISIDKKGSVNDGGLSLLQS